MANAIDICRVSDVRSYLGLNPVQVAMVSTTIATSISAGLQTVTPASMGNIVAGSILAIGSGTTKEYISVTSTASTTFTATFALAHTGPVTIQDETDSHLSRVITAASAQWIRRTGNANDDGTYPTHSPLVEPVTYDEYYDGNGGQRQFLRHTPINSVTSLSVSGATVPPSLADTQSGFVIDQSKKSIAIRGCGSNSLRRPIGYRFLEGIQNVHIVYVAGFAQTPDDIIDCCIEMVALNYKRRNWLDQKSDSKPDTIGNIRYQDWELPPKIVSAMQYYSRGAIV